MREDERDLPAWVANTLAPHQRHALSNPTRRRILRALNNTPDAQTVSDLFDVVPADGLSALSYHVKILEKDACVSQVGEAGRANGNGCAYVSNVADNLEVMDALRATEREDQGLGT
ncbi:MAG TPA: helix-turn-helix domain-containing protein [Solirubrobacterales bacterium]|nr:helix-turn-helix domain-containing protein [Solirubrobacterales bacterium]